MSGTHGTDHIRCVLHDKDDDSGSSDILVKSDPESGQLTLEQGEDPDLLILSEEQARGLRELLTVYLDLCSDA